MPLRMAEVWTRKSADVFADAHIPLSAVDSGRIDVAFAPGDGWREVLRYTDASLAPLVVELAQRGLVVPEPGAEVGPDESVWQVELAWPAAKVAVVIDDNPDREAWLTAANWKVVQAGLAHEHGALADQLFDHVGGN